MRGGKRHFTSTTDAIATLLKDEITNRANRSRREPM